MNIKKEYLAIVILVIFYTVGIFGLSFDSTRELFLKLTPFQLLLTLGILTWGNGDYSKGYLLAFIIAFLIGFWVEVAGVFSGVLFGSYVYGAPLGWQILDVPLMIGVNWFILSLSSKGISSYFTNIGWIQIPIAAMLMVGIDFLIEPVAVNLDFWQWQGGTIPVQNYIMWFITALFIQLFLFKFIKQLNTTVCFAVYFIQVFFFAILNMTL